MLYSKDEWDDMEKELSSGGKKLIAVVQNLVDEVWKDRPERPLNPVMVHNLEFAGKTVSEKLTDVRAEMTDAGCETLVLTALDEIACK